MEEPLAVLQPFPPPPEGRPSNMLKSSPLPSGPGLLAEDPLPGDQRQEL